jgi:hypothetical protein
VTTKPRATAVSVDPTGLTNVTSTDVQGAIEDLDAVAGGGGTLTVQDENGNVATGVTQIDFQGAGVAATSGTGEVIVTISGGGGSSSVPYNRALGKTYTLSAAPNATYPDASTGKAFDGAAWGGSKLTDGNTGGVYTSGQNIGYNHTEIATTVSASFDLGSSQSIGLVVARGRYGTGGVYRPVSFKVEHSDDNSSWTTDLNVTGLANGGQPGDDNWIAQMPITVSSHRYWRMTFGRDAVNNHWLFLNEIELWG